MAHLCIINSTKGATWFNNFEVLNTLPYTERCIKTVHSHLGYVYSACGWYCVVGMTNAYADHHSVCTDDNAALSYPGPGCYMKLQRIQMHQHLTQKSHSPPELIINQSMKTHLYVVPCTANESETHMGYAKKWPNLFLSELCQISTKFNNFWHTDSQNDKIK